MYDNAVSRRSWLCWCDNWRQRWTEIHFYGLKCGLFWIALHLTGRAAMHLVVPSLTEQDCVVLDSAAISCSGLDGTGLAELLRIALLCTALDWTRLDCYWLIWTWATLDLNILSWEGMNGIRRERTGLDWTARQRSGPDWTELDSTSEGWTARHCTSLDWTVLVWAWLQQTAIHCTTQDWIGKYHTQQWLYLARLICTKLHSTFPKFKTIRVLSIRNI